MADNYLEKRREDYLARKEKAERKRKEEFRKRLEEYKKKIGFKDAWALFFVPIFFCIFRHYSCQISLIL